MKIERGRKRKSIIIIDDEDLVRLSNYWIYVQNGYVRCKSKVDKKTYPIGRLLLDIPKYTKVHIDHKDHNPLNNSKKNLRVVSVSQNQMNKLKTRQDCLSKFKGVTRCNNRKKWTAQIKYYGQLISLGSYENEIDAAKAYNKKAHELFGPYACLNSIP